MTKLSSYQKLKAENESLRVDIRNLIRPDKFTTGAETRKRYEIMFKLDDLVWGTKDTSGNGLYPQLKHNLVD